MNDNCLGSQIKAYRRRARLSQAELAAAVRRDRSWIAHVERGDCLPQPSQLLTLAGRLNAPADALLLYLEKSANTAGESRMCRWAKRQFSLSWKSGYGSGTDSPRHPTAAIIRLQGFLEHRISDRALRAKLKALSLGCCEAAYLALSLLERGAQWARLSLASVGFPMPLLDSERCCINHLPRQCLVWSDRERSLVLFGETFSAEPRYLPPVLAWTDQQFKRYLTLEGERFAAKTESLCGLPASGRTPKVITAKETKRYRCALQRLLLRGTGMQQLSQWLESWMFAKPEARTDRSPPKLRAASP
ncbi:helix-turn-helix domain-containing protein [bacterium]|nr:helix-turn-helix domain-containing protein [bacterium]